MDRTGNSSETLLERLGLNSVATRLREFEVPSDGLTWTRFFGSMLLVLVVLLFLSGAFLAFYYSPAPGVAYDSVDYAQFNIPFGDVVRGIHYYAWNLLLIVMGLHLALPFLWSRTLDPVWYARVQVSAGVLGVFYGLGLAVHALGII